MPHIAFITVPHPIGGINLQNVMKKADEALEDVVKILTMPRDKLSEQVTEQP